jgi:orotate phosphoribosyltransferase-like protein
MIASAMMVKSKRMLRTIVVRKNEELTHSGDFAGQYGWEDRKNNVVCFVDDFCASGSTLKSVMFKSVGTYFHNKIKYVLVDHIDDSYELRSRFPQLKFLELEDLEAM